MPLDGLHAGLPCSIEDLLYTPENSLIVQSLHARLGVEPTNGDGFGVGWYDERPAPGLFRSTEPAWNDRNLREVAGHIRSRWCWPTFAPRPGRRCSRPTATRSGTGGGCGCTTACSPGSTRLKRDLALAVDPELFPDIEGSTDSELFFYLALTFGLRGGPAGGGRPRRRPDRGGRPAAR